MVKGGQWTDTVFLNASVISFTSRDKSIAFDGNAGVVRQSHNGSMELTIFHGTSITGGDATLSVNDPDLGFPFVSPIPPRWTADAAVLAGAI